MNSAKASTSPASGHHIAALDGVRGLAILAVLVHHLNVTGINTGAWPAVAEFCGHGVDLFFVLSGFLITRGLVGASGLDGWRREFLLRRAAKIVPVYLLVVGFVFLALPAALHWAGVDSKAAYQASVRGNWPWYLGFASNMRNALDGRFTNPALDVAWSLGIEMQFYLLALIWFGIKPGRVSGRVLLGVVAVAIAFRAACVLSGASWITILALTPGRLDAFAVGAALAVGLGNFPGRLRLAGWLLPLTVLCVGWSRESPWVECIGYTWVALSAGLLMDFALHGKPDSPGHRLLRRPFLRWAGKISYSVYLTHLPVRAALRDHLTRPGQLLGGGGAWSQAAFYLAAGATCLLVGWLLWFCVEWPLHRGILRRFSRARPAASAPSA